MNLPALERHMYSNMPWHSAEMVDFLPHAQVLKRIFVS